jgi:nitrite reductase/ring-hydroxylating ferredoxin subunit
MNMMENERIIARGEGSDGENTLLYSTANQNVYRFPFPAFPNGWFPVLLSADIKSGEIKPVHRFGKDLLVYRTEQGVVNVVDPYCPHLGTHIGFGGKVIGDELQCPFHKWRFGPDGKCVAAHGAKRVPAGELATYHSVEKNGAVFVWHDAKGREPFWEVPEIPETSSEDYRLVVGGIFEFKSHPQEAFENQPDALHLSTLHGYEVRSAKWDCGDIYTSLKLEVGGHDSMDMPYSGCVDVKSFGPSISCSWFVGDVPAIALFYYCPTTAGVVYNPLTFWIHKSVPDEVATVWAQFIVDIYVMDIPIWENKRYASRPLMSDADGPIAKMRNWYKRWYE